MAKTKEAQPEQKLSSGSDLFELFDDDGWIPVFRAFPPHRRLVLVTCLPPGGKSYTHFGFLDFEFVWTSSDGTTLDPVTAWMPAPPPANYA